MIRYKCCTCGQELESPTSLAGKMDTCPACSNQTRVPSIEQNAFKSAPRRKRIVLMVGIGLVLLGAIFHCIFCEWVFDYTHSQVIIAFSEKAEPHAPSGQVFNGIVPRHSHDDLFSTAAFEGFEGAGEWKLLHHGFSDNEIFKGTYFGLVLPICLIVAGGLVVLFGWPKRHRL
jgi:hypothetical protein